MKIGVNTLFLIPGEVGGSETYVTETLRRLTRLWPDDEYVVFANTENTAYWHRVLNAADNVTVEPIRLHATNRYARIILEQTALVHRIKRARVDVLWSPGYTAPLFTSVPQIVSILDMQYRRYPEDLSWLARLTTHVLLCGAVRRSRRIMTISAFSAHEVESLLPIVPGRIDVTPLAVDPAFSISVPLDEEHEMLRDMPYLLCVANSYPHKNIPLLVEGFARLHTPMRLVLVGKPRRGEAAVQSALARLDAQTRGRVVRIDHLTREALIALYQHCAVFVFPSLYEGFGLPVLEAMLAGVPVVAADIPTMREIGGAAIRLCHAHDAGDMAESIRCVLDESPAETRNRRDAARRHAQTYTWERTARLTHACFERALAEDPIAL